jgi:ABC-type uncharacterized transport system involved in gliding motility auxiliary subunit
MNNRRLLTGSALAILAVLFVAVVLLSNALFRGARLDLTTNHLYTLSEGTKKILGEIDEPVHLYYFFSDKGTQNNQGLRTYATRVREMLDEMAARAGGKLKLDVIDPLPYSEDEDRATTLGLKAIPVGQGGENLFFGLAGTNSTNGKAAIPILDPAKEEFLEYDVAKLIHGLAISKKPVVGIVSSLPISAGFDPSTRQMRDPWAVQQQLDQLFDVRQLSAPSLKTIDPDISVLVLIHPKDLTDDALYAIDQFVLRGGHLAVFVDPIAESEQAPSDPSNPAAMANKSSDLPKLFKAWGVLYDPNKVVLDRTYALQISTAQGAPPIRHVGILGFTGAALNPDDVTTAKLQSINASSVGFFQLDKDSPLKLVPLIQTSKDATTIATERFKMLSDPKQLLNGYEPTGQLYIIAGRLQGKFKSAFPEKTGKDHLTESKQDGQIVLVADTDLLTDRLWVQIQDFFGQKLTNAFANNGDFFINTVDNLTGSSELISIRGRATSQRSFTTVERIKRTADERFRNKETQLQQELNETERKLTELQSGKSKDQAMILSPEQQAELLKFQDRKLEIRKELRGVRRQMDADIESLGTRLKMINIFLMPLLVILLALGFAWWKRQHRAAN